MKKDNFDVHRWNHRQKMASIINEVMYNPKEYNLDAFILTHDGKDFFDPFFDAINKDEARLDPTVQGDWEKIIKMDEKTLIDTYGLTPDIAKKVKDAIDKDIAKSIK